MRTFVIDKCKDSKSQLVAVKKTEASRFTIVVHTNKSTLWAQNVIRDWVEIKQRTTKY